MESGLNWIYAHCVTIYWWKAYHLVFSCSISWFLEVSLFWQLSSDLLVTIAATLQWGFIFTCHFANKCWMSLYLLFSKLYLSKLMECLFVAGYWIVLHIYQRLSTYLLGHMIVFIPVAPISYVALSSVILYPLKRIRGAKNISSKQTCCFSLMLPEPARWRWPFLQQANHQVPIK